MQNRGYRIVWYYALGVIAAAQLGKMAALMPLARVELAMSLTAAAFVISLLEIGGATLGRVAASLGRRAGLQPTLLAGIGLIAIAGIGESLAGGATSMYAWRALEGLGYLGVVTAAPLLIIETATDAQRGPALSLWSSFVPAGVAAGAIGAGTLAEASSWRGAIVASAAIAAVAFVVTWLTTVRGAGASFGGEGRRGAGLRAWQLAVGFGCYALFEVGLLALLPTFLVDEAGATPRTAGLLTGLASFATVAGSALAAWLAHRRAGLRWPIAVCVIVPAVLLFFVFRQLPQLGTVAAVAVALNAISGVLPAIAFSLLPHAAGSPTAIPAANGLITQFGASGSLLGPPLMAWCVARGGWPAAAWCGAILSAACLVLMLAAIRPLPARDE
ncbi:CynX/NimT family MFS transporter [Tahibacter soli]|uniref:MFS transporter n=1 Tax=Tahibacter soli TaxID=2983605 RepID=A0A9X4BIX4_9GAMM|nr:MFS transporter [Tahibacter soli]MDC8012672.1 MFS transporter [Tahibacter soli]